jgi:hypothetical protein
VSEALLAANNGTTTVSMPFAESPTDEAERLFEDRLCRAIKTHLDRRRAEIESIVKQVCESAKILTPVRVIYPSEHEWSPCIVARNSLVHDGLVATERIWYELHFSELDTPRFELCANLIRRFYEPTRRNVNLFVLLHELGHAKLFEERGVDFGNESKEPQPWWYRMICWAAQRWPTWMPFYKQAFFVANSIHACNPIERQATKYALEWMKEMGM